MPPAITAGRPVQRRRGGPSEDDLFRILRAISVIGQTAFQGVNTGINLGNFFRRPGEQAAERQFQQGQQERGFANQTTARRENIGARSALADQNNQAAAARQAAEAESRKDLEILKASLRSDSAAEKKKADEAILRLQAKLNQQTGSLGRDQQAVIAKEAQRREFLNNVTGALIKRGGAGDFEAAQALGTLPPEALQAILDARAKTTDDKKKKETSASTSTSRARIVPEVGTDADPESLTARAVVGGGRMLSNALEGLLQAGAEGGDALRAEGAALGRDIGPIRERGAFNPMDPASNPPSFFGPGFFDNAPSRPPPPPPQTQLLAPIPSFVGPPAQLPLGPQLAPGTLERAILEDELRQSQEGLRSSFPSIDSVRAKRRLQGFGGR